MPFVFTGATCHGNNIVRMKMFQLCVNCLKMMYFIDCIQFCILKMYSVEKPTESHMSVLSYFPSNTFVNKKIKVQFY